MSNKRGNRGSGRIPECQEKPPLPKRRTIAAYFGGGNVGKLQDSQVRSPVEKGDSSQVGPSDHIEVQVGEPDISVEDELEHDLEALPLSRESQTEIIELESVLDQSGEKTKTDSINHAHAQKGKRKLGSTKDRSRWDLSQRSFQLEWVEKYWFIEPVPNPIDGAPPTECRCNICSEITKKEKRLQLKIDTIEKHVGKVYKKEIIDGVEKSVLTWKTKDNCLHIRNAEIYELHQQLRDKRSAVKGSIEDFIGKATEVQNMGKVVQLSVVFYLLSRGRPMTDYPSIPALLHFLKTQNYPNSHWSVNSGWEWARCLAQVEKEDMKEKIKDSNFIALSLDEVTAIDNTSWVCMHVYTVNNLCRQPFILSVAKLNCSTTAENLYELLKTTLIESGGLDSMEIAKKLVCVGADGASVMQGHKGGLCKKIKDDLAPYAIPIHCMAHRMNLTFGIVSNFGCVSKVESLIKEIYQYFCRSPKRVREFQHFSQGLTDGKKLLKDNDTRWISLDGPAHRVMSEYPSLLGLIHSVRDRFPRLYSSLTNVKVLLTLAAILPMLQDMRNIIKKVQQRAMYIAEYNKLRKMTCSSLDTLYRLLPLDESKFAKWIEITDLNNPGNFLHIGANDEVYARVRGVDIPMQYYARVNPDEAGSEVESEPEKVLSRVTSEDFKKIKDSVLDSVKRVCYNLSSEIRDRFPPEELLEAMSIVFPQYWSLNCPTDFRRRMTTLIQHFCKPKVINGITINGILDESRLRDQSYSFANIMREQYALMENPNEEGAVTKLWKNLGESNQLREAIPEYFKLTDLCLTMILGSVEDERVFSTLGFLKSKVRNKLDKNLDNCLRLYNSRYEVENFPYDRAVSIWRKRCQRRGIANISNPSGSGSGGGNGSGSGSYPDIGSNEDDVDFGMHSESDADSESEENTTNNQMLYAINEEDSDDSDAEPVQAEWQL